MEPVRRFDAAFDLLTERSTLWDEYWFPHNADFLNWRYLDHPTRQYLPFAAVVGAEPVGYCVVQIAGERAWLMDFVAAPQPFAVAHALLLRAVTVAREAGCGFLTACAPPRWRHCGLVRSAGFVKIPGSVFMYAWGRDEPGVQRLENWQFLAGDMDGV